METKYASIVAEITEKIKTAQAQTLTGAEFLKNMYATLNEATNITPMLSLKPFITGAEKISGDDATLKEIMDFIKKKSTGGDLNFIINLIKEEHLDEMKRAGHPDPKATIAAIKEEFEQSPSVIEEGIRNGIFDGLSSKLLNQVKVDLNIKPANTKQDIQLNEGETTFLNLHTVRYSPIGIKLEDAQNNKIIMLTESEVLEYDRVNESFKNLNPINLDITAAHKFLMTAITSCPYNPETGNFSLNENWDFSLELTSEGKVLLNGAKEVAKEDVKKLLFESVQSYIVNPGLVNQMQIDKTAYNLAADKFIALMENESKLIMLDKLTVIKNLSENSYVMFDKEGVNNMSTPAIISSSAGIQNKLFESYAEMIQECDSILKEKISPLFESQLKNENNLILDRNQKLINLNEEQKMLNQQILNLKNLQSRAEENSPALDKLNEQQILLDSKLNENIKNLQFYNNEFKLY